MTSYALKDSTGTILRYQDFTNTPPTLSLVKGLTWVQEEPPLPPAPTQEQIIANLTMAVQHHLDVTARARNYDGILSACSYATDTHPPFMAEGQAAVNWRGSVWLSCYQIMAEVQAGTRTIPTADELVALLPMIVWPV